MTRTWTLKRVGERPVNTNAERDGNRHQRARLTKQWRTDFHYLARQQRIPLMGRVQFVMIPHYSTRRSLPDTGACAPSAKAAIDGIVDAGVIPDDTSTHVAALVYFPPVVDGWDGLEVRIEEVA